MSRLPSLFLKCILALGTPDPSAPPPSKRSPKDPPIVWTATGFLYGHIPPGQIQQGYVYLVTNRHVVEDVPLLYMRFNPAVENSRAKHYGCPLLDRAGRPLWCGHPDPDIDVAVIPFDFPEMRVSSDSAS